MQSCSLGSRLPTKCAQATPIWKELTELKRIVCEPRGAGGEFETTMKDYYAAIEAGRGAIFFAIFRGKVRLPISMSLYFIAATPCLRACSRKPAC